MCGAAENFTDMLAGRCIQGGGVGGIMTLTETIITDRIPLRHRGKYFAWASIMGAVETVSGPLIGGVLSQRDAWRWIFLLNLPIVSIGFTGVILFLKLSLKQRSLIEKLLEIDYLGSFIFISSLTFSSCLYHGGRSNASMVFMAYACSSPARYLRHWSFHLPSNIRLLTVKNRGTKERTFTDEVVRQHVSGNHISYHLSPWSYPLVNRLLHAPLLHGLRAAQSYTPIQAGLPLSHEHSPSFPAPQSLS